MKPFLLLALIPLAGCHGHVNAPAAIPYEVDRPVTVGCVPANIDVAPDYPDTDSALLSASGADERYQLLYAGRKLRVARLNEIEPVVAGCPKAPAK